MFEEGTGCISYLKAISLPKKYVYEKSDVYGTEV